MALLFAHAQPGNWSTVTALLDSFNNLTVGGCNATCNALAALSSAPCDPSGCSGFFFSAGDATGRKFSYAKGVDPDRYLPLASASKFPAAVAIAGEIAAGRIGFETKAADVFEWWTTSPSDPRSRVTLRHLLSFTSGM